MASSIILNKEDRLAYIKEAAQRMKDEKRREKMIYETDTEVSEQFNPDFDYMSIENLSGFAMNGIEKIQGGFRKLPMFLL